MLEEDLNKESRIMQAYGQSRSIASSTDAYLEQSFADLDDEDGQKDQQVEIQQDQNKNEDESFMDHLEDIPVGLQAGLLKTVQETGNFAIDVVDWVDEAIGSGQLIDEGDRISALTNPEHTYQPDTMTGKITREITSFLVPFGTVSKAAKGIKAASKLAKFTKAGSIGFAVDFAQYDPHEERLSNLIQKVPELNNPISEYLAASRSDSRAEGRFKNAIEGLFLGTGVEFLAEGMTRAIKAIRSNRVSKNILKDTDEVARVADEQGLDLTTEESVEQVENLRSELPEAEAVDLSSVMNQGLDEDSVSNVIKSLDEPVDTAESAINIKLENIRSGEDVQKVINSTAKEFKLDIDEARRGVVTDDEVRKLASDLNMGVDELLSRQAGQAFSAEQLIAGRRVLNVSAANVAKLAKNVAKEGSSDVDKAAFLNALNLHRSVQASVSGATAEAGRALRSMSLEVGGLGPNGQQRFLNDFLKQLGGSEGAEQVAKRIDEIMSNKGTKGLSDVMTKSNGRFIREAVFESWINSLLSGPKTHLTNIMSNSTVLFSQVAETAVGRGTAIVRGAQDSVQEGEVYAQITGLMAGLTDGLVLAGRTLKEGVPASVATKLDEAPVEALSAKSIADQFPKSQQFLLDNEGGLTKFGKAIDMMAKVNRLPSRMLLAEDEFFKAVNMRMKIHQLATRQGRIKQLAENLSDADTEKFIKDMIDNPPADIMSDSIDSAKVNTFTNDLAPGSFGQRFNDLIKTEWAGTGLAPLRVIMPFVRTPINILEYAWDRVPFKPGNIKKALNSSGAERDMAIARIGLGSAVMGSVALMARNGMITGRGPGNVKSRKFLEDNQNFQQYSIKVGDTFVKYDRLDPWGQVVGIAADMASVFNELDNDQNQEQLDLLATGLGIIVENATPEFMTENLGNFLDIIGSSDRERNNAIKRFATNSASGLLPLSGFFRNVTQAVDPVKRETRANPDSEWEAFDQMYNKIIGILPGMSDSLPPKRNLFGEEIPIPGAIFPLATMKQTEDPVVKEMARLGMNSVLQNAETAPGETHLLVDMPKKYIQKRFTVAGVGKTITSKLNPEQYDKYVQLAAGIGLTAQPFPGLTLKQALTQEVRTNALSNNLGGTDEAKRVALKKIILEYRKSARNQMILEERSVLDEFMEESAKRQDAFNPTNLRLN